MARRKNVMRWYTAIGMKKDDADGRFCVWVDGEEKVLTEMETILWAALTWSFCEEDKVHSQMHRLLVFSLGEKQAQEWADKEDFQFCLNRLVKRGLVVLTEGCTREEAVYSFLSGTSFCQNNQAPLYQTVQAKLKILFVRPFLCLFFSKAKYKKTMHLGMDLILFTERPGERSPQNSFHFCKYFFFPIYPDTKPSICIIFFHSDCCIPSHDIFPPSHLSSF